MNKKPIIVVGGGLAGLMATLSIAERGRPVLLFSMVPVKRSHSVCAQGGINAAVNIKGEGDTPWQHFDDTVYGGDFLANQTPVQRMCEEAPKIVYLLDRMGVMFSRTDEGFLEFRRFGGTLFHRTAFAGATTGQQILYALDEQVRRYEADGTVQKYEGWDFLSCVLDGRGICRGIVALDRVRMEIKHFAADAVILATGGLGALFGKSTNSILNTGGAATGVYQQGALYANGEFIQVHPTAIPGTDKLRLISESVRGEGGRVWTYRDGKPWYFLEEWYPRYGNLVPRDIAARAIHKVCHELNLGIDGQPAVHLDITHLPAKQMEEKLGGVLEIYRKFVGEDPTRVPMKIFPAVHYTMGGLWVGEDQMTSLAGLFAAGECHYQFHGANRLGANSLLSCIYDGGEAAKKAMAHADAAATDAPTRIFEDERKRRQDQFDRIYGLAGDQNAHEIHAELGALMTARVTVVRDNESLREADAGLMELCRRADAIGLTDATRVANQEVLFVYRLRQMLALARVITLGALNRNESRGSHYKPEFPERDDQNWLKTTLARHSDQGPVFSYEAVDLQHIVPRQRKYDQEAT